MQRLQHYFLSRPAAVNTILIEKFVESFCYYDFTIVISTKQVVIEDVF